MLIDFTVTNFRSIRDETTLSFHAEHPGRYLTENIGYPGGGNIGAVRSIGIYGANASGKSNLLLAFDALKYLVRETGQLEDGDAIRCYEPYRLSSHAANAPVRFEVEFFTPDGIRYIYRIAFTSVRILEEELVAYPSTQPATLFSRSESDTWKTMKFGTTYKGGKKRFAFFPNNAYLSKAGNSADAPESVRAVFNYFRHSIFTLREKTHYALQGWQEDDDTKRVVAAILSAADTGIERIEFEKQEIDEKQLPDDMPASLKRFLLTQNKWRPLFSHATNNGDSTQFDFDDESAGTQRLFELAPLLLHVLAIGGVLVHDEIESRMHPLMAEVIVKLFNDSRVNTNAAQLLFATHNADLMSSQNLRRDQIWFAEKEDGASRYYSLADFDKHAVKPTSPFNRWYLEGRFDAVPRIDYNRIADTLIEARQRDAEKQ